MTRPIIGLNDSRTFGELIATDYRVAFAYFRNVFSLLTIYSSFFRYFVETNDILSSKSQEHCKHDQISKVVVKVASIVTLE